MNYTEDIAINRFNLPVECEQHAGKAHEAFDLLADAKSDLNEAEDKLKLIISQRDLHYRKTLDKTTEGLLKSVVEADDEVQNQKKFVALCQRKLNSLEAVRSGYDHRKSMLNNLTSLQLGGFYAAPEGSRKEVPSDDKARSLRKRLNDKGEEDDES